MEISSIWKSLERKRRERSDRRAFDAGFRTWLTTALTDSQIQAAVSHSPETLVLAGAGSGKTALLLGRTKYLVESQRTSPERILALAFNSSASYEIRQRAARAGITLNASTFHKFGNDLLNSQGRRGGVAFAEDHERQRFMEEQIRKQLASPTAGPSILEFFSEMLVPFRHHEQFSTLTDYAAFAKAMPRTFGNERVKSHGELVIANYLFRRGANYEYEALYQNDQRSRWHRPDFTVQTSDGRKIYIEYFGIDREGNTAPYIDRDEYHQSINWKREIHRETKTTLIELTYQDLLEGTITDKLDAALNKNSVAASWRTASDLVNAANAIGYTSRFVRLCLSFHSHARAQRLDAATIGSMQPRDVRHAAFIRIFRPIAAAYEAELLLLGLPDYSEMIHGAADGLFDGTYEFPFDHVLVDEFQDISADRYRLLEAMKFANPAVHFFYVGDDWQSIYRFAGSDIGILRRMCRRRSKVRVHRLRETFRMPELLARTSSQFVQRNPAQIRKEIISTKASTMPPLVLHTDGSSNQNQGNLHRVLTELTSSGVESGSLLVVARYRDNLPSLSEVQALWKGPIEIKTIHQAKGGEADYVILMDAVQDLRGFPSTIVDDPILELVQAEVESYEFAEERRLFYVALTRARVACHIISPLDQPSLFISELLNDGLGVVVGQGSELNRGCPECRSGTLSPMDSQGGVRCSNRPLCQFVSPNCPRCASPLRVANSAPLHYECPKHPHHQITLCPACKLGVLTSRQGRYGAFLGCTRYSATGCKGRAARPPFNRR